MGAEGALSLAIMIGDKRSIGRTAHWGIISSNAASRSDLLRGFERWTYSRKIKLCTGLWNNVIVASEVILAHGLAQDEIDRWMQAYKMGDFESLKIGYGKKRRRLEARPRRREEMICASRDSKSTGFD